MTSRILTTTEDDLSNSMPHVDPTEEIVTQLEDCSLDQSVRSPTSAGNNNHNENIDNNNSMAAGLKSITKFANRSIGGSSPKNGVYELLECPVCFNFMFPPIYQCPNGHTLCSTCKTQLHHLCPVCRYELGNIRCLALEKVAGPLEFPCKNQPLGCHEVVSYGNKLEHEAACMFGLYPCPYTGSECQVKGDIETLVKHLKDDHKVDMHNGSTFNHRYVKSNPSEVENATWMLTVFSCFDQYFCLHFEAFQIGVAPVYMAFIRFMGPEEDAKLFSYSLQVGGYGRKLVWQGVPRSIRESHKSVRDSHEGLIVQRNMALFFSGGDRKELKLRVTGKIWRGE